MSEVVGPGVDVPIRSLDDVLEEVEKWAECKEDGGHEYRDVSSPIGIPNGAVIQKCRRCGSPGSRSTSRGEVMDYRERMQKALKTEVIY